MNMAGAVPDPSLRAPLTCVSDWWRYARLGEHFLTGQHAGDNPE